MRYPITSIRAVICELLKVCAVPFERQINMLYFPAAIFKTFMACACNAFGQHKQTQKLTNTESTLTLCIIQENKSRNVCYARPNVLMLYQQIVHIMSRAMALFKHFNLHRGEWARRLWSLARNKYVKRIFALPHRYAWNAKDRRTTKGPAVYIGPFRCRSNAIHAISASC